MSIPCKEQTKGIQVVLIAQGFNASSVSLLFQSNRLSESLNHSLGCQVPQSTGNLKVPEQDRADRRLATLRMRKSKVKVAGSNLGANKEFRLLAFLLYLLLIFFKCLKKLCSPIIVCERCKLEPMNPIKERCPRVGLKLK